MSGRACVHCGGTGHIIKNGKDSLCSYCGASLSYSEEGNLNEVHVHGSNHKEVEAVALSLSQSKPVTDKNTSIGGKTIKEKFENHPVVFGGGLLISGLIAGVAVMKLLYPYQQATIAGNTPAPPVNIECTIDGLSELSNAHNQRASRMQEKLLELEAQASDRDITPSYQKKYLESANRLRLDINSENSVFKEAVSELNAKCKKLHNN